MNYYKKNNRGQSALIVSVLFSIVSTTIVVNLISPIVKEIREIRDFSRSREGYFLAEASLEDVVYRLQNNKQVGTTEVLSLNGFFATTTLADVSGKKEIVSGGSVAGGFRKVKVVLDPGIGTAFFYGISTGRGGFEMENSSVVNGNIYANGPVEGHNSAVVHGDVVSAGPTGFIEGIHSTSSAYANTIKDSTIDKNAYYQTKTNTIVGGISYPGSADQPTTTMPISDSQIADWEADALAGGTYTSPCPYNITVNVTLGPKKINCDLNISGNPTITLNGNIWVSGNIDIANTAILQVGPGLSGKSVAIIADNPSNRTTSSKIALQNSTQYLGNGSNSYIMLISQNNSSELGGEEVAIDVKNSATGKLIAYSNHGEITLQNSMSLKEVTAYKLHLKNTATVNYESGLQNLIFSSGPSGGYEINSWEEVE